MGEAACLLRSFSHPSESSLKAEQGDPIRVLGESISFGRFMSESLAWEKWSSFSQNRYLEEVEKFSKPGSVAQKKAYFEAHYKKKALQKEANFFEETNAQSATVTLAQTEVKGSPSEFTRENSGDVVDKDTTLESNVSDVVDANVGDSPVDKSSGESSESKEEEEAEILQIKNTEENEATVENSSDVVDKDTTLESNVSDVLDANVGHSPADKSSGESSESKEEEEAEILQTKNTEDNEATVEFSEGRNEILESCGEERRMPSKKRLAVSSLKLGPQIGASKLPPNPAKKINLLPRQMNNALSKSMKPTDDVLEKARLPATAKSLHASMNFPSGLRKSNNTTSVSQSTSKRRLSVSSQKSRPQIGASKLPSDPTAKKTASLLPRQMTNAFSKSLKPTDHVLEKARLPATAKSLHASMNFPSGLRKSNKATSFSQTDARSGMQKDIPKPQKTTLKASENAMLKKSSLNPRSNDRRILSQSVSILDRKLKSSVAEFLKSSSANGNKLRPPTVRPSFNSRMEERALRRKEFFQRLEEKAREREREKKNELQTRYKNKTAPDNKKIQLSTSGVAKPSENHRIRKVAKQPVKSHASSSSYSLPPTGMKSSMSLEKILPPNRSRVDSFKLWIH